MTDPFARSRLAAARLMAKDNAKMPETADRPPNWPIQSFDAQDWAKEFCRVVKEKTGHDLDEEWMISWFACALMRGWDEHRWRGEKNGSADTPPATAERKMT